MEKLNKLSLPLTIIIASIILGGFYYATQVSKQNSIEKQQQIELQAKQAQQTADLQAQQVQQAADLQAKQAQQQAVADQNNKIAAQRAACAESAQQSAVYQYQNRGLCAGTGDTYKMCHDGTYNVDVYDAAYSACLQSKGLK